MTRRPLLESSRLHAALAALPMVAIILCVYVGGTLWAAGLSFTNSSMLPNWQWAGLARYATLFGNDRWLLSLQNMSVFALVFIPATLLIGYVLAALLNRGLRGEAALRTIFLYPFALSFIVTGLIWRWTLDPAYGLGGLIRAMGFESVQADWLTRPETALYCIALATIWHSAGLVMVILLAGMRGVDEDLWKALRIDGIPTWRAHLRVIAPAIIGHVATATILMSLAVVRLFDVVVAMTGGGPGIATEVPAKFIIDHMFERQQVGLASAAATVLLLLIAAVIGPILWLQARARRIS